MADFAKTLNRSPLDVPDRDYGWMCQGDAETTSTDDKIKASPRARRGRFFGAGLAFFRLFGTTIASSSLTPRKNSFCRNISGAERDRCCKLQHLQSAVDCECSGGKGVFFVAMEGLRE